MTPAAASLNFEISIDGKPLTHLDTKVIADGAAAFLKKKAPRQRILVRDLRARPAILTLVRTIATRS